MGRAGLAAGQSKSSLPETTFMRACDHHASQEDALERPRQRFDHSSGRLDHVGQRELSSPGSICPNHHLACGSASLGRAGNMVRPASTEVQVGDDMCTAHHRHPTQHTTRASPIPTRLACSFLAVFVPQPGTNTRPTASPSEGFHPSSRNCANRERSGNFYSAAQCVR